MTKKLFFSALLICATSIGMYAQVAGFGAISGTVKDASGGSIANAKVTVANESKGIRREIQTNGAGLFTAPALVPADGYRVTTENAGFGGKQSAPRAKEIYEDYYRRTRHLGDEAKAGETKAGEAKKQ